MRRQCKTHICFGKVWIQAQEDYVGTGFTGNQPLLDVALPTPMPLVISFCVPAVVVVVRLLAIIALE